MQVYFYKPAIFFLPVFFIEKKYQHNFNNTIVNYRRKKNCWNNFSAWVIFKTIITN